MPDFPSTYRRVCVFVVFIAVAGCLQTNVGLSDKEESPEEWIVDGSVVLGSPSLTAGIVGGGPLSMNDIESWLADERNHVAFDFVLPASLAAAKSSIVVPQDNPLTRAKIELGRQMFFDKRLSGIGTFSCATCHRPDQSYSSYQVMPEVGRNASMVVNRILGSEQFWDGRASSLEEQPLSPIKNPFEMNSTPEKSTRNIQQIPGYVLQFKRIFGEVSFENICKALASFERVLVTGESAWDANTMSEEAKRGETLFFSDRLGCADCHAGRNLTDEQYHNLGTVAIKKYDDTGRFKVTRDESDKGSFKTPSLRNVALTPPYMHNGAIPTLEATVEFFNKGGHGSSGDSSGESTGVLTPLHLTDAEKKELVEFLKSLTSVLPPVAQGRLPE